MMRKVWVLLAVFLLAALLSAPAAADVVINDTNFPDPAFRAFIRDKFHKNDGDSLSNAEIAGATTVKVEGKGIRSLEGIKHFTALGTLECQSNDLTSLDVSKNTELVVLDCRSNDLTALDVRKNTNLRVLACQNNQLMSLDVSKNTNLEYLGFGQNQLALLDVSKNRDLNRLDCSQNQLTALDVSQNTKLEQLYCNRNRLTSLDVSANTKLEVLHCQNNDLVSLDVSANTKVDWLYCQGNHLTFLDLQGLPLDGNALVGGQTRGGLPLQQSGGRYEVNLGTFIPREGFSKVTGLAGRTGGTALTADYDPTSGKGTFNDRPEKVMYWYDTGKAVNGNPVKMDVTLTVANTITVSVSGHGRVTLQGSTDPLSGDVAVSAGSTVTFVVSADAGYEIDYLRVDNAPVSVPSGTARYEHTIPNVGANHRLEARFKAKPTPPTQYTIQVTVSGRGKVTSGDVIVSGPVSVDAGSSVTFVASADAGYEIDYLRVDNAPVSVPSGTERHPYTFPNVAANHTLEAKFKAKPTPPVNPPMPPSNPGVPPVNPPTSPDMSPVPPVNPPAPPVTPPASPDVPAPSTPADIPVAPRQWTVSWGAPDVQGRVGVTVRVPIKSEAPLIESSIRVKTSGIEKVSSKLLLDGRMASSSGSSSGSSSVSAYAAVQKHSYVLQVTGTVAESARNTARIDAVHYKLEGSDEERAVRLGTDGSGILLKDMTQKSGTPEPDSGGGGCDAGVSGLALALAAAFLLKKKA